MEKVLYYLYLIITILLFDIWYRENIFTIRSTDLLLSQVCSTKMAIRKAFLSHFCLVERDAQNMPKIIPRELFFQILVKLQNVSRVDSSWWYLSPKWRLFRREEMSFCWILIRTPDSLIDFQKAFVWNQTQNLFWLLSLILNFYAHLKICSCHHQFLQCATDRMLDFCKKKTFSGPSQSCRKKASFWVHFLQQKSSCKLRILRSFLAHLRG